MGSEFRQQPSYQTLVAFFRLAGAMGKVADAYLRQFDLTQSQFNVLIVLAYERPSGAKQTELCEELLVKAANMTALVRKLEGNGLIRRGPHESDERAWWVTLTPAGRRLLKRVEPEYHRIVEELMAVHSGPELRRFAAAIDRTHRSLQRLVQGVGL